MKIDDYKRVFGSYYAQHLYFDLVNKHMGRKDAVRLVPRVYHCMTEAEKKTWRDMLAQIKSETAQHLLRILR
jgi:hypothetical protein